MSLWQLLTHLDTQIYQRTWKYYLHHPNQRPLSKAGSFLTGQDHHFFLVYRKVT
ncbi:MAG: hypothetical protein N838_21265 [Thiohalocapsa sp. PB-PSB1]|nr:MAG: hypothetical protein N838_21265 [Thiohalocapsa sp. PB-PSB1]